MSGIHRLFSRLDVIQDANCVIAVAGMEGALASVLGGLVDKPVIAVPTSVGYGASMNGLSALLTMINSCANGIAVVNIDNGYGAGYIEMCIRDRYSETCGRGTRKTNSYCDTWRFESGTSEAYSGWHYRDDLCTGQSCTGNCK